MRSAELFQNIGDRTPIYVFSYSVFLTFAKILLIIFFAPLRLCVRQKNYISIIALKFHQQKYSHHQTPESLNFHPA